MLKQAIAHIFWVFIASCLLACNIKKQPATVIRYKMEGCFGSEKRELRIYKYRDSCIVTLIKDGKKVNRATVTEAQMAALASFRKALKDLPTATYYYSTRTGTIVMQSGGKRLTKQYSGHWDGFDRLTYTLLHITE